MRTTNTHLVRTNIALSQSSLLPIHPLNPDGKEYGLHPNLPNIQQLFETEKLAFIANCGVLVQPTTMSDFNQAVQLPFGLFSHSDQASHWQTSLPQDRRAVGWGGRLADILHTNNTNQNISMSISLNGTNLFQRGNTIQPFSANYNDNGSTLVNGSSSTSFYNVLKRQTLDDILEQDYQNTLEKAYANVIAGSKTNSIEFDAAVANGTPITVPFEDDGFSKRLKMTARIIAAHSNLGVTNQTFFIQMSGYDNHDSNLDDHAALMAQLDSALYSFYQALEEIGMQNDVTTFTISDFGRKLVSNGDGTDHAWGGHVLAMGGAVKGKKIYGSYPDLYLGAPLDTGGGRFIPTTSTDELLCGAGHLVWSLSFRLVVHLSQPPQLLVACSGHSSHWVFDVMKPTNREPPSTITMKKQVYITNRFRMDQSLLLGMPAGLSSSRLRALQPVWRQQQLLGRRAGCRVPLRPTQIRQEERDIGSFLSLRSHRPSALRMFGMPTGSARAAWGPEK